MILRKEWYSPVVVLGSVDILYDTSLLCSETFFAAQLTRVAVLQTFVLKNDGHEEVFEEEHNESLGKIRAIKN